MDPEAGRKRRRLVGLIASRIALVLVLFVVFVAMGLFARNGYRSLVRSDVFSLRQLHVQGAVRLTKKDILDEMGVAMGTPLLMLDMDVLQTRLVLSPWIKDAEIHRRLPHRLDVKIEERRPVAILALGKLYLVDHGGNVFKRYVPSDYVLDLPLITGLERDDFNRDSEGKRNLKICRNMLKRAIDLIDRAKKNGIGQGKISEIHLSRFDGDSIVLNSGLRAHLPSHGIEPALGRLAFVLGDLEKRGWAARDIFLNNNVNPKEVTVRLAHDRSRKPGKTN
ncbi:MAG: FtsQ-type POTRA domain-containing protein [Deltaproteobacteria bacterium]|nr:FtsQ-type POTRA domain-containing protein [Deltaproteobacteria bacterium]